MPTDPLSRGNTPVFCKLCFTAWQQWKFIKSHELCSVTWESRCLQGFAKGRKLPWNSSEFLSVGIKCGNQDKCGIERAYKEFIKKDSVWETECCKEDKGSEGALYRNRVWIIGTKVKESWKAEWADEFQKYRLQFLPIPPLSTSEMYKISFHQLCNYLYLTSTTS